MSLRLKYVNLKLIFLLLIAKITTLLANVRRCILVLKSCTKLLIWRYKMHWIFSETLGTTFHFYNWIWPIPFLWSQLDHKGTVFVEPGIYFLSKELSQLIYNWHPGQWLLHFNRSFNSFKKKKWQYRKNSSEIRHINVHKKFPF